MSTLRQKTDGNSLEVQKEVILAKYPDAEIVSINEKDYSVDGISGKVIHDIVNEKVKRSYYKVKTSPIFCPFDDI